MERMMMHTMSSPSSWAVVGVVVALVLIDAVVGVVVDASWSMDDWW